MKIEVFSDTVCPWCYVGVVRLRQALAQRPALAPEVHWLPYELNPDMPVAGEPRDDYMRRRFGDVNRFAEGQGRLRKIGAELDIDFRFDLQQRMVNTRRSHMLIAWAAQFGAAVQTQVKTAILEAYFTRGLDIGNEEVLVTLASDCGRDAAAARAALHDQTFHRAVVSLEQQARLWQISGVPTFIFNRKEAFSGAQEQAVMLEFIDRANA